MWEFFKGLEPCGNWQCVNSFASWLSTLLTLVISGGALFISIRAYRYAKKKDVETLSISVATCILATRPTAQNAFSITVTNFGHRSAVIKSYTWVAKIPFSPGSQLLTYFIDNDFKRLSTSLPATLEDGGEAQFFQDLNVLGHHTSFIYNPSYWRAWLLINSLRIDVTTTKQRHHQRLPRKVRKLIWSFYRRDVLHQQ